ncbi:hypothetical protein RBH29_17775, partial [Herbivorax sp. ANBcel31]|uniref:hypothetical protein n=1 Tax=Herbivorax sp. ANBcel31 TaxID=3069754 RepID=UPI0027B06B14
VKVKKIFLVVTLSVGLILTGCGGGNDNQQSDNDADTVSETDTETSGGSGDRTNAEIFLDYLVESADRSAYTRNGNSSRYSMVLDEIYKDDIINPYTGGDRIYISVRGSAYLSGDHHTIGDSIGGELLMITPSPHLEDLEDKSEIVYCVNEGNKGSTVAIVFHDGAYVYEIDENGEKKNEVSQEFEQAESFLTN